MKVLLTTLFASAFIFSDANAQSCNVLDTAIQTPLVLNCVGGTANRSGVAWNPNDSLYYSCNAGSASYPFETFSSAGGASVATYTAGVSWRGLWWNPGLNQLEGNAISTTGWLVKDLDVNGIAVGTNTTIFAGQMQPNSQSCGDLDTDANEVIFYDWGSIYRYDRATGTSLGNYALNGIPGGALSDFSVVYTGCAGQEIGVYDYTNKRVHLFDKATGNFVVSIQLPSTAPAITTFRVSYANNLFWLYDGTLNKWVSFQLFGTCTATTATDINVECESFTWMDGNTYTSSNNSATYTLTNAAGCDSVITLDLTILQPSSATDIVSACDTYTWMDGITYTSSNNSATHILSNAAGCDSIVTLNLTLNNSTTGTDVITACGSYTWMDGTTYTSSNNSATHTLTNAAGCDSIVTLNLTLNPLPATTVSQTGTTLTADENSAQYQWLDCDNNFAIVPGETGQSFTPAITGNYAVEITLNGCSDTSACTLIDYTGIEEWLLPEKELVKIVDVMGKETDFKPNTLLIYIFSDGTMERIMKLEE